MELRLGICFTLTILFNWTYAQEISRMDTLLEELNLRIQQDSLIDKIQVGERHPGTKWSAFFSYGFSTNLNYDVPGTGEQPFKMSNIGGSVEINAVEWRWLNQFGLGFNYYANNDESIDFYENIRWSTRFGRKKVLRNLNSVSLIGSIGYGPSVRFIDGDRTSNQNLSFGGELNLHAYMFTFSVDFTWFSEDDIVISTINIKFDLVDFFIRPKL